MEQEIFLKMIHVAIISSIISTQIMQKIKHILKMKRRGNKIISIIISFLVGYAYSLSFYSPKILYAIWVGIFTLIGAETIYRNFNGFFGLESLNNVNNEKKN